MYPADGSLIHTTDVAIPAAATTLSFIPSARVLNEAYTV